MRLRTNNEHIQKRSGSESVRGKHINKPISFPAASLDLLTMARTTDNTRAVASSCQNDVQPETSRVANVHMSSLLGTLRPETSIIYLFKAPMKNYKDNMDFVKFKWICFSG
ncbi:unnamed protein product [Orchesella dallaii]|uniref:Uncharacterized protein n=1 Tax=Orchesella dallaii TaxID=48710 RepID=A0ABP1S2N5_9HEXA